MHQVSNNIKKLNRINHEKNVVENMFYKAPYFSSNELLIADKVYGFFNLYNNNFFHQKVKEKNKRAEKRW